jgi:outer membrane protein assembly factor BamD
MKIRPDSIHPFWCAGLLLLALNLAACSGDKDKDKLPPDQPVDVLYNKAANLMDQHEYADAAKAFSEVERQHPYSQWATRAQLMEAYADYQNLDYDGAAGVLDQFIELHPGNPEISYAYYLRALCYYERIADVTRDQATARDALKALQDVITRYPDTTYAKDAALKVALVNDHLAGAEMNVGRWYLNQKVYIAAIGRFKIVIEKYQTTSHVPEALERLVECYLALGIPSEAKATASVLGYNFPGSDWYQDAYNLLVQNHLEPEADSDSWIAHAWKTVF